MNRAFPVVICLVLFATPLLAETPAASSSTDVASWDECQGPVSAWRENVLSDEGTMSGFLEAVRDHQAWLDNKGYKVRVRTWTAFEPPAPGTPLEEGRADKRIAFGNEVVYPSFDTFEKVMSERDAQRDEAYEAFVKKYAVNTKAVKTFRLLCLSE